jgi:hypothetical protein
MRASSTRNPTTSLLEHRRKEVITMAHVKHTSSGYERDSRDHREREDSDKERHDHDGGDSKDRGTDR